MLAQTLAFFLVMLLIVWMHNKWRNAAARKNEIRRLVHSVSEESAVAEFEANFEYNAFPRLSQCAVCFVPTSTRCSQCKSIHYCSGKCQIVHWRHGHRDECQFLAAAVSENSKTHGTGTQPLVDVSSSEKYRCSRIGALESNSSEGIVSDIKDNSKEMQETKLPPPMPDKVVSGVDNVNMASKKSSINDQEVDSKSQRLNFAKKVMHEDIRPAKLGSKKSIRRAASSEKPVADDSRERSMPSSSCNGEDDSLLFNGKEVRSFSFNGSDDSHRDASDGAKKSIWRKVQQLKASKQSKTYKITFPYELFVKLYSCDEELYPFGLRNCGNSCYANSVLQCLAFTRPFTSYLIRGLHSYSCPMKRWCFTCEFEGLIHKARQGESPLSPIGILSKIQKIGSHLGRGTEEDAHEFLRYAVDAMQAACLEEAGRLDTLAEETTLVGLTFGGYLRSKIKCMRCHGKFERFERIMDLTVEIDGDIQTLEEALSQFTADEMLDGANKYHCSRCKAYVKAKKKLMISEAPNILTIVLKRFRSDSLEKLNKSVRFPKTLNMTPYLCGKSDKSPPYSLYAVIVHRDEMNATSTGHYVCYVKNKRGEWFGINDSAVTLVQVERVLSEEAYMLLYARICPRPPALLGNDAVYHGVRSKKRNLEAVPSSLTTSKTRNSHISSSNSSKAQQKHGKYSDLMNTDDSLNYPLRDPYDWRFHAMQRAHHADSSSETSSFFSSSDTSSSSSTSTKDSIRSDDLTDFIFGDTGPSWYGHVALDSIEPSLYRNMDADWRWNRI